MDTLTKLHLIHHKLNLTIIAMKGIDSVSHDPYNSISNIEKINAELADAIQELEIETNQCVMEEYRRHGCRCYS